MNKVLLASHGPLAEAMKTTAEFLMGKNDSVHSLCAYIDESAMDLPKMVDDWQKQRRPEDSWVVVADVFGGSVCNEFMSRAAADDYYLIAGMNLALVLSLWPETECLKEERIREIVEDGRNAIVYCNELLNREQEEEDF